jgi:NAD(P)-dependent dehydrogenase (short-subunit alcohol dehydrogenase family)
MRGLADRVAVITGAGSGIGLATAMRLASEGTRIVAVDVDEAAGKSVADETGGMFVRADGSTKSRTRPTAASTSPSTTPASPRPTTTRS